MKYFFFILVICISQYANSQTKRILILDSLTHTPISDVIMKSQKETFFSGVNGEINIRNHFFDSILFIHINYFQKFIQYKSSIDTVFMQRKPQEIEEISVKANHSYQFFEMGYFNIRKRFKNKGSLNASIVLAVFIPYDMQNTFIDEILLDLKLKQHTENYGVYLYQPDSLGLPGKILYNKKIVVDSLKKEGVIMVRDLNIRVPENGIFIGLENFKTDDSKDTILGEGISFNFTENIDKSKSYVLIKNDSINPNALWYTFEFAFSSDMTPCFGLRVYQKN